MPYENEQWYRCTIDAVDYIKSEKKGTPALELTCSNQEHGVIVGQWWLTDSLVSDPRDKNHKVPQWQAAMTRCELFGCNEGELRGEAWIEHIRQHLVGAEVGVCVEVNSYGDVKAKFIGKPKNSGGGGGYAKQDSAASPFNKPDAPVGWSDDDTPF